MVGGLHCYSSIRALEQISKFIKTSKDDTNSNNDNNNELANNTVF